MRFLIVFDYVCFYEFGTSTTAQKTTTAPWKRRAIKEIHCHYLKHMLRILISFWLTFFCRIFEHFLRLRSCLWFWHSKKHPKNYHSPLKKVWHQFYCHICEYCWGFISFLRFWHSKYHPKNCHSSLKKVWNQRNLLSLFQIHVNRFDKIVIQIFFVTVVNIFELMFSFQGVSTHRKKEKVTRASLNGCRIVYSCLHPLEYIIWFPLK